jgi:hypothetical protein
VLWPGQPNGLYHSESVREAAAPVGVLPLSGRECHIFVGSGDGPCANLMIGARSEEATLHYPVSELAAKHGASAGKETSSPREAYADWSWNCAPVRLTWQID